MTSGRTLPLVLVIVCVGVAACTDTSPESGSSEIEIAIDIADGQRWSTSGEPGWVCEGGSHRWVGYRAHDGSPTGYDDGVTLTRTHPERVLLETQLDCSDGTGTISIAWKPGEDDRWMIVGGSGAYSGVTGGGSVEDDDDRPGGPKTLLGEISKG